MKHLFAIILLFSMGSVHAQGRNQSFREIDRIAASLDAPAPDSLAALFLKHFTTERDRSRAAFIWITRHISYNTGILQRNGRPYRTLPFAPDPGDTIIDNRSATEMTARRVMRRRIAVCDGYARLFKALCDYMGVQSEIVTGYASGYVERPGRFRTNHSWNAVRIDSNWHLVDATWASGYVNFLNQYVASLDETYYLADPARFNQDHFPEDSRWTLMAEAPLFREFRHAPFRYKSFAKYMFRSVLPSAGLIEANEGDTLRFELVPEDAARDRNIASDPFFDSSLLTASTGTVFLYPEMQNGKLVYSLPVNERAGDWHWVNIMYNDDMILRYRLNIRRERRISKN